MNYYKYLNNQSLVNKPASLGDKGEMFSTWVLEWEWALTIHQTLMGRDSTQPQPDCLRAAHCHQCQSNAFLCFTRGTQKYLKFYYFSGVILSNHRGISIGYRGAKIQGENSCLTEYSALPLWSWVNLCWIHWRETGHKVCLRRTNFMTNLISWIVVVSSWQIVTKWLKLTKYYRILLIKCEWAHF